jgi:Glycosyl hydrolase family 79, N-terminal domain
MAAMDRRQFLSLSALGTAAWHPASRLLAQAAPLPVTLTIGKPTGRRIAEDFTGLSYESAQLSDPDFFAGDNKRLIELMGGLGQHGVLRIGGNTSEYCFWRTDPQAHGASGNPSGNPIHDALGPDKGNKAPPRRVITEQAIRNLREFLNRLPGWSLIYGLNLGLGTPAMAAEEAAFVSRAMGSKLLAFQMANEPDLFFKNALRPASYNADQFITEWRRFFEAVRKRVPDAPFAGPDTAFNNDWLVPFARAFRNDVKFVSSHYYAEGPPTDPEMDIPRLLRPDPKLDREFAGLEQVTKETGLPFRLAETNSCYGGGKKDVSDTFASALWGADYMFRIAQAGGIGVNFHGGGYGWYAPIAGTRAKGFEARPLYYGMRLFREASAVELLETNLSTAPDGLRVYAVQRADGHVSLTALNLSLEHPIDLTLDHKWSGMQLIRLKAPDPGAKAGETLGDAAIGADGSWHASSHETVGAGLHLPPASGALVCS